MTTLIISLISGCLGIIIGNMIGWKRAMHYIDKYIEQQRVTYTSTNTPRTMVDEKQKRTAKGTSYRMVAPNQNVEVDENGCVHTAKVEIVPEPPDAN